MTVKQLLIGALLGATAVGAMLHRLPKSSLKFTKPDIKPSVKIPAENPAAPRRIYG